MTPMVKPRTPVRRLRQDLGWNQKDLAEASGVPAYTISRFELGHSVPNSVNLLKIANALGCKPWELLDDPTLAPQEEAS